MSFAQCSEYTVNMTSGNRERFVRLANQRVNRALKTIRLIGNLSTRSNYSYTNEDVEKIFRVLNTEIRAARTRFAEGAKDSEDEFTLEL